MHRFCQQCAQDISNNLPLSHCFFEKSEKINGISVFYGSPGKSTLYKDANGILTHVKSMLLNHGKNPWVLHIDGEGYKMKHARQIAIVFQFLEFVKQGYADDLMLIEIICPSRQMQGVIAVVWPFLPERLKSIVTIRSYPNSDFSCDLYV